MEESLRLIYSFPLTNGVRGLGTLSRALGIRWESIAHVCSPLTPHGAYSSIRKADINHPQITYKQVQNKATVSDIKYWAFRKPIGYNHVLTA